ncbi:MAG: hypothetical protein AAFY71_14160 [Bacteroidota bacterium]
MSEKRYFKIFAKRHIIGEKNNYLILFEVLENLDQYDQQEIGKGLAEKGVPGKYLAADKNYLYNLIMRGLSSYHSGKTVSLKIKEYVHQVEILYEKSLYDQCLSLVKKGKKLADKYDLYPLYIELSSWEQKVLIQQDKTKEVAATLSDAAAHLARLDNMNAFMQLYYRMNDLARDIPLARSKEEIAKLNEFISHPFLKDESIAMSFQARLFFWKIYARYYQSCDNKSKELEACDHLLSLMDSNENYAQEFPFDYLGIYSRLLTINRYTADEQFNKIIQDLQSFPNRIKKVRRNVELRISAECYDNKIRRNIYLGRIKEAQAELGEQEAFIKKFQGQFSKGEVLEFQYLFSYIHLLGGSYKFALKWINFMLNEVDDKLRPDIQPYIRILNLVTHYELENYSVLKYAADRAYRYLKRKKLLHSTERTIVKLFQQLAKMEGLGIRQVLELMKDYRAQLNQIFEDPFERKALAYFDILSWLDAKISGLTFSEIRNRQIESGEISSY